jgi:hypothetical protein
LANKELDAGKKDGLEDLRARALAGNLRRGDLANLRKRTPPTSEQSLEDLVKELQAARRHAVRLKTVTPDIPAAIDHVIGLVRNLIPLHVARLDRLHLRLPDSSGASGKWFS